MSSERVALATPDRASRERLAATFAERGITLAGCCADLSELDRLSVESSFDVVAIDASLCPTRAARQALAARLACPVLPLAWFLRDSAPKDRNGANEEGWRILFEQSPSGIMLTGLDGELREVSPALCQMFGLGARALSGMNLVHLVAPEGRSEFVDGLGTLRAGHGETLLLQTRLVGPAGKTFGARVKLAVAGDRRDSSCGLLGWVEDMDSLRRMEVEAAAALGAQREALVREVHHRIKNNLQAVAGLLRRQLGVHPELAAPLESAIGQVNTMAIVHGLQSRADHEAVRLVDVLAGIGVAAEKELEGTLLLPSFAGLDGIALAADEAVPIAMVLNELILNALKHGSVGVDPEPARLEVARRENTVSLRIENGFSDSGGPMEHVGGVHGHGLKLVRALLPPQGTTVTWYRKRPGVLVAELVLSPPVVCVGGVDNREMTS